MAGLPRQIVARQISDQNMQRDSRGKAMRRFRWFLAVGVVLMVPAAAVGLTADAKSDEANLARHLLARAGLSRGICALPRCGDGALAVAVAESSGFLVHALDSRPAAVAVARRLADEKGLLGHRVIVEKRIGAQLPYADNCVDLVLVTDLTEEALGEVSLAEVVRVLRPRGRAILGRSTGAQKGSPPSEPQLKKWLADAGINGTASRDADGVWAEFSKPVPAGVGSWRHWYHEPDNNPISRDAVIKAPYLTQWLGKPYYAAMPVVTTAAGGRIFVATGHIAHHDREIPALSTVCARNGYNGAVLWKRKLPEGYLVHRSAFVATEDTFYMIDGNRCLLLDPETGAEKGRIAVPGLDGDWKWIALSGRTLFVLAGDKEPEAQTTLVRSGHDHWSWGALSKGYYRKPRIPWGFARTVAAYDLDRKKALWVHREPKPVDSRAMGVCDGKVFFYAPESRIGCIDAKSGETLWTNADAEVLKLIEEPGKGLQSLPGFRTSCMMLCTPVALFFQAQQRMNIVAVSARDGKFLWTRKKIRNDPTLLFADGKLVIGGRTVLVDPLSGKTLKELGFWKAACTRMTGCPDAFFCRGEGLGRYDRARGEYTIDGAARPGCNDGAIPANGLLYVGPWLCDCNLSLIGTVTLCPAADFRFDYVAREQDRLEHGEEGAAEVRKLQVNELDWPTYRANNQRSASSMATVPTGMAQAALWSYRPRTGYSPSPPTAAGGLIFVGGSDGKVRCINAQTGKLQWDFATAGPIRLPPTIWEGRALVGSGDGYIYALEAATGRLLWRFRAAPVQRRIMVYGSLCSTWPVNSGVLVQDGVAYAAAGIIDRDGTYVYALDARTGGIKWQNNETGHLNKQLRKGVSVQGDMTIAGGRLWMAGGNQVSPACYDLKTGRYMEDRIPSGRPAAQRGCEIGALRNRYIVLGGRLMYSGPGSVVSSASFAFVELAQDGSKTGRQISPFSRSSVPPAWDDHTFASLTERYGKLGLWDPDMLDAFLKLKEQQDRQAAQRRRRGWPQRRYLAGTFERYMRDLGKWEADSPGTRALAMAKNAIVLACLTSGRGQEPQWSVRAYEKESEQGRVLWERPLPGEPVLNGLLVDREGRVVVVMMDGSIVCFGQGNTAKQAESRPLPSPLWMTIGPFPTPAWEAWKGLPPGEMKKVMARVDPPMKEINFDAEYVGAGGKKVRWHYDERILPVECFDDEVGVSFGARCGVSDGMICYAVTFIKSPEDRGAEIRIGCDWWANAYLNGELIRSQRPRALVEQEGAYFNGLRPIPAWANLKKGINTLLVKCHGGSFSSCFALYIQDPGDLKVAHKPQLLEG